MNPRDTAANMNRRRMIRRGATYGPHLPEGEPDDGAGARHRRLRHLRQPRPPVRVRAERLDQRQELPRARQRARSDHRQPGRHARVQDPEAPDPQEDHRPAGLHHGAGAAPTSSCRVSRRCATSRRSEGRPIRTEAARKDMAMSATGRAHLQPDPRRPAVHAGQAPHQHLLDLELSVGGAARPGAMENRFSTITEVRNVLWPAYETPEFGRDALPAGHRRHARAVPPLDAELPAARGGGDRPSGRGVPARRPGRLPAADRRTDPRRHATR